MKTNIGLVEYCKAQLEKWKDIPRIWWKISSYQYDKNGKLIKIWSSTREIEKNSCYFHSAISACCLGKTKQAYNYVWSYEEVV